MNRSPGPISIVVMGASGCGKSTVGRELAARLGLEFKDGDDLHPATNVSKMAAGDPLTDEDRWPWLTPVGQWLAARSASGSVVACSALRRAYRDVLRDAAGKDTLFVYLDLPEAVLLERVKARDHFFPPHLLRRGRAAAASPEADAADAESDSGPVDCTGAVSWVRASARPAVRLLSREASRALSRDPRPPSREP